MKSYEMPATCPNCGVMNDMATPILNDEADEPRPGDLSICLECSIVSVWNDEKDLRPLTNDEAREHLTDPEVQRAQRIIRSQIRKRKTKKRNRRK